MALAAGTRIGPYEVVALLGAGGMGEVYRARDTKLNRDVALKILPDVFSADADRLTRFKREAQVLASLNHSNIAQIYGFEDSGATHALALELVDGPTLEDRIAQAPLALGDALPIARQMAEALEAAHEQGIIHRDLKPANVKVRADGTVKVLDFGLAKALDPRTTSTGDAANSPTMTARATQMGMILGTAAYMSPEQARGREVDRRADIWAFGAVVYEMLTGRRAFEGDEVSTTLAAVLKDDVNWPALPSDAPASLRILLRRCLERDPKRRLRDIGEARVILDDVISGRSRDDTVVPTETAGGAPRRRERVWMALASVSLVGAISLAALLAWKWSRPVAAPQNTFRFSIDAPEGELFPFGAGIVEVSRDGRELAFITGTSPQTTKLWVRSLDTMETRQVLGVTGAHWPTWSPTGRYLVFSGGASRTGPKLIRVDVSTGGLLTLADCMEGPATWSVQSRILFTGTDSRIHQISENGGASTAVTELDAAQDEVAHGSPSFLPDGRRFVFQANKRQQEGGIYLATLDSRGRTRIADAPSSANWTSRVQVAAGYLMLQRATILLAQPFDVDRGVTTGEPRVVVEGAPGVAAIGASIGAGTFSASDTGVLVLHSASTAATDNRLTWFDRTGKPLGTIGGVAKNHLPRISPDGSHVVVPRFDNQGGSDIFIIDLARDVTTRLTSDGASTVPMWADAANVVFVSRRSPPATELIERSATGENKDVVLFSTPGGKTPSGASADGKYVLFNQGNTSLVALPRTGERTPITIVANPGRGSGVTRIGGGTFSPDGRWIAYYTEDADGPQAYVTPFPSNGQRIKLSTTTGYWPQWSKDGTRIIYVTEEWHFMEVSVPVINGTIRPGKPTELFVQRQDTPGWHSFAFDPVKERFLLPIGARTSPSGPLTVVVNWMTELAKR